MSRLYQREEVYESNKISFSDSVLKNAVDKNSSLDPARDAKR